MRKHVLTMGLVIAAAGQVLYHILTAASVNPSLRAVLILLTVKLLGDFLGRFVLKLDHYNWVYLRDYLMNDFITRLAPQAAFLAVWLSISYWFELKGFHPLIMALFCGGILPAGYYLILNRENMEASDAEAHRLKRKL